MANSFMLSADNAHATHPNFPQKSDPCAPVRLGGGVVLKYNASQSTRRTPSAARSSAPSAGRPTCRYRCSRTAPTRPAAARWAICRATRCHPDGRHRCAQFAMHSAVETASVADAEAMTKAVAAFYRVHLRALGDGTYTLE